ncbi:Mov34/MPN/PAD-1 family protein [Methanospirillum stamsii]|uniref:Proteasome protein n=1 Tax=Methanospirillum stamsii TaxID=1277351 RepID=A0A2V2MZV3_9EURY|nr:Mov34/MPN/PAD-1 family protein [Methanospirillum stamsii]PWR73422.1 proteasome protein [Methanospirillum stamsii]
MNISAIKREKLDLLLAMGRNSHPREFAALLSATSGVITDVSLIPGSIGGEASAQIPFEMVPLNLGIIGSAHSHPNGAIWPSDADIRFFAVSGSCHIIVGYPYGEDDWRCFHPDGSPRPLEVVE